MSRRNIIRREPLKFWRSSLDTEPAVDPAFLWIACMCPYPKHCASLRGTTRRLPIYQGWGGKGHRTKPPIITVVQHRPSVMGNHATPRYAASSAPPDFLAQSKVRTVFVMVGNVLRRKPFPAPLVESNHILEQLAAAASHPTLGHAGLPRTCERSAQGIDVQESDGCRDLCPMLHPRHGLEIWEPHQTEMPPATAR
jgi:hypothetical protein